MLPNRLLNPAARINAPVLPETVCSADTGCPDYVLGNDGLWSVIEIKKPGSFFKV
jgi:hypothetical protein